MAAPQPRRGARFFEAEVSPWPVREREWSHADRARVAKSRRRQAERRRRFALLVVIPVLLMLGSVYLHTVAGGLGEEAGGLEERLSRAEAEGQKLDVKVAALSAPGRIRERAEDLGMKEPGGEDLRADGKNGEGNKDDAGEEVRSESP